MENNTGIYCIKCLVNNKIYIGSSVNIQARWNSHLNYLRNNRHHSSFLQRSWIKHCESNFTFEVIAVCHRESLTAFEKWFVVTFKPEYNLVMVRAEDGSGFGGMRGKTHSEESKAKMRAAASKPYRIETFKNRCHTPELSAQHSKFMKDKLSDPKEIELISIRMKAAHLENPNIAAEHSRRMREKFEDPLYAHKMSEIIKSIYTSDPDKRIAASIKTREQFSNPDQRVKMARARGGKPILCIDTGEVFQTAVECADVLNIHRANLITVLRGRREKVSGLRFKYIEEDTSSEVPAK